MDGFSDFEDKGNERHYLLDSNIISEIVKPEPSFSVIKKLVEHSSDCAMAAQTWHEMLFGVLRLPDGRRKSELQKFLKEDVFESFPTVAYDERCASVHAQIRAEMERSGNPVPYADSQIAAIAVANGMTLATRNVRHFIPIQSVAPLLLENWFDETP